MLGLDLRIGLVLALATHGLCGDVEEAEYPQCQIKFPSMTAKDSEYKMMLNKVSDKDCGFVQKLATALEDIGVFNPSALSCYVLESVLRKVHSLEISPPQREITFTFTLKEYNMASVFSHNEESSSFQTEALASNSSDETKSHHCQLLTSPSTRQHQKPMSLTDAERNSSSLALDREILKTTTKPTGKKPSGIRKNNTEIFSPGQQQGHRKTDDVDKTSGLSQLQIIVIATCSAVIGTFFIVAAVMRCRYYLKRLHAEQMALEHRGHYRGQSGSHSDREASSFVEPPRKDSAISKSSRKLTSDTDSTQPPSCPFDQEGSKGMKYYPVNSHDSPYSAADSPAHGYLSTNPVLVVTAPSTGANTPTDSHASIQFIDEGDISNVHVQEESSQKEEEAQHLLQSEDEVTPEPDENQEDHGKQTSHQKSNNTCSKEKESPESSHESSDSNVGNSEGSDGELSSDATISNAKNDPEEQHVKDMCTEIPEENANTGQGNMFITSGFAQSDESLSCSHSASVYCYGNQMEYVNNMYNNAKTLEQPDCSLPESHIDNSSPELSDLSEDKSKVRNFDRTLTLNEPIYEEEGFDSFDNYRQYDYNAKSQQINNGKLPNERFRNMRANSVKSGELKHNIGYAMDGRRKSAGDAI